MGTIIGGPRKVAARARMGQWDLKPLDASAIPVNFSVVRALRVCARQRGRWGTSAAALCASLMHHRPPCQLPLAPLARRLTTGPCAPT
jgi:hypothetical protein